MAALVLIFMSAMGALSAYSQFQARDPALVSAEAVARRAELLAGRIRAADRALAETLGAVVAANAAGGQLAVGPALRSVAGYAVFGPDRQPLLVSDAAAVAPARSAIAAASGSNPPLALLQDYGEMLGVVRRQGDFVAVALIASHAPSSTPTLLGRTGDVSARGVAAVGVGDLVVYPAPANTRRWLLLGADLVIALAPAVIGLWFRRRAREAERKSRSLAEELDGARRRFRIAVNGAGAGVFEYAAADGGVLALSSRLRALLGAPSEQITAHAFLDLVAEPDRAHVQTGLQRAAETGVLEIAFRTAGRANAWIEMRGLAIEDSSASGVRIVGTGLDDTPRREAESRASAMERRLRAAIEGYTGPVALWDAKRRLVTCNASYVRAFQLEEQARQGAPYSVLTAASLPSIKQQLPDAEDPNVRELELGGGWLKIVERATPDGGLVTVGTDITALKQQERILTATAREMRSTVVQLERSEGRNRELAKKYEEEKRRAEDASRAKSAFLANMSHELRTPLNAIIGFSEIISSELLGSLGNPKYQEYALDIFTSGQLLLDLINDILDMAKIEAGKLTLNPKPLETDEAIAEAVRLMRRRAEEKGLQLMVDCETMPTIEADHRAVKQMLLNLLSNAIKFTPKGGVMVRGRPSITGGVSVTVADTGPGIPPEYLPKLGRPFEQVEIAGAEATKQGGTGLGLALTRALAEMHGGSLHIESELGRGTMVTIALPPSPPLSAEAA